MQTLLYSETMKTLIFITAMSLWPFLPSLASNVAYAKLVDSPPRDFIHLKLQQRGAEVDHYCRIQSVVSIRRFAEEDYIEGESGGEKLFYYIRLVVLQAGEFTLRFSTESDADKTFDHILKLLSGMDETTADQHRTGQTAPRPAELPANLVQVVSGGDWKDGEKHGFVRFSTFEYGFDHLSQQIVVEWIQHPTDPNERASVVSRMVVKEDPLASPIWSFGQASFRIKEGKTSIKFEATNTREQDKRAKFSIEILGLGKVKITQGEQHGGGQPATRPESK
jgi:hypothetical protein